ncbi:hypothetical protein AK812_SmicGene4242 [Symbiodinium microadriaticum]|uniref:Uncharacterized protein n=1 Tax=Symbiodinium microadriaticum TaxID=2951 RepID=A0A1Q9EWV3_SYMMI|nr:hypothetical protein AK812_SmicGene4242 [Symbiodinium microadriaticum]
METIGTHDCAPECPHGDYPTDGWYGVGGYCTQCHENCSVSFVIDFKCVPECAKGYYEVKGEKWDDGLGLSSHKYPKEFGGRQVRDFWDKADLANSATRTAVEVQLKLSSAGYVGNKREYLSGIYFGFNRRCWLQRACLNWATDARGRAGPRNGTEMIGGECLPCAENCFERPAAF